jgi:hypothetical protein
MAEEVADVVLLQADHHASIWTQLCCQHADGVLLIANAADPPAVSKVCARVIGAAKTLWPPPLCVPHTHCALHTLLQHCF